MNRSQSKRRRFLQASGALIAAHVMPLRSALAAAPMSMAYLDTYNPISFREEGKMGGILIDILDEVISRRLKIPLEHFGYPWKRAQEMVQRGEHDALCATPTQARLEYAVGSQEPVLTVPFRIFVRADNPLLPKLQKVRSLDELRSLNPTVISYAGNGWTKEKMSGFKVDGIGTVDSSWRMLDAGRGDIVVENLITAQQWLRTNGSERDIRMMPHAMDENSWHLLINKNSPHAKLMPAFDKAMHKFRLEAAYHKILERYGVNL